VPQFFTKKRSGSKPWGVLFLKKKKQRLPLVEMGGPIEVTSNMVQLGSRHRKNKIGGEKTTWSGAAKRENLE